LISNAKLLLLTSWDLSNFGLDSRILTGLMQGSWTNLRHLGLAFGDVEADAAAHLVQARLLLLGLEIHILNNCLYEEKSDFEAISQLAKGRWALLKVLDLRNGISVNFALHQLFSAY